METSKIDRNGTLVIPVKLRWRYGLNDGGTVVFEDSGGGISIPPAVMVPVEAYSPERKAEFLLNNAADYKRAVGVVEKLGIDPESIPHGAIGACEEYFSARRTGV